MDGFAYALKKMWLLDAAVAAELVARVGLEFAFAIEPGVIVIDPDPIAEGQIASKLEAAGAEVPHHRLPALKSPFRAAYAHLVHREQPVAVGAWVLVAIACFPRGEWAFARGPVVTLSEDGKTYGFGVIVAHSDLVPDRQGIFREIARPDCHHGQFIGIARRLGTQIASGSSVRAG